MTTGSHRCSQGGRRPSVCLGEAKAAVGEGGGAAEVADFPTIATEFALKGERTQGSHYLCLVFVVQIESG